MGDDRGLVIVGGGGHGVVVAEAAVSAGFTLTGFVDDRKDARLSADIRRLGGLSILEHEEIVRRHPVILGLGDLSLRREVLHRLNEPIATVIHPCACVAESAAIAPGVFIGPHALAHSRCSIGAHAILNSGAIVEHDCGIGENAHIGPGAALGGDVIVGADTLIGLGARVIPGVRIGAGCVVGAGAVVVRDVEDGQLVTGVPAQPMD